MPPTGGFSKKCCASGTPVPGRSIAVAPRWQEMARAAAAGELYPLVLVDAVMPEMDGFALVEKIQQLASSAPPTIMMLTSADRSGDAKRCRQLGLAAYLVKPIKAAELRDAIVGCLAVKLSEEPPQQPAPARTDKSPARAAGCVPSLRVLLAEDNPVNQRVALHLLDKLHHVTTVVGNGQEALAAIERQEFDLVLMDVQMPGLDGFEATHAVRQAELSQGKHLPIIAMTAHAMKGDRERCLAAGMDEYVSKPIRADQLLRAISAVTNVAGLPSLPAANQHAPAGILDREAALDRLGGNEDYLREIANIFLEDAPHRRDQIRSAVAKGDLARLREAAHMLRGAIGYFGAGPASEATLRLERAVEAGEPLGKDLALAAVERHLDDLMIAVAQLASLDQN